MHNVLELDHWWKCGWLLVSSIFFFVTSILRYFTCRKARMIDLRLEVEWDTGIRKDFADSKQLDINSHKRHIKGDQCDTCFGLETKHTHTHTGRHPIPSPPTKTYVLALPTICTARTPFRKVATTRETESPKSYTYHETLSFSYCPPRVLDTYARPSNFRLIRNKAYTRLA